MTAMLEWGQPGQGRADDHQEDDVGGELAEDRVYERDGGDPLQEVDKFVQREQDEAEPDENSSEITPSAVGALKQKEAD